MGEVVTEVVRAVKLMEEVKSNIAKGMVVNGAKVLYQIGRLLKGNG